MKIALQQHANQDGRLTGLIFSADTFEEERALYAMLASLLDPNKCTILGADRVPQPDGSVRGDGTNGMTFFVQGMADGKS